MERCYWCLEEILDLESRKEIRLFHRDGRDYELVAVHIVCHDGPEHHTVWSTDPELCGGVSEPGSRPERRCNLCRDSFAPCPDCFCGDLRGY